jgi:hypothetical protein
MEMDGKCAFLKEKLDIIEAPQDKTKAYQSTQRRLSLLNKTLKPLLYVFISMFYPLLPRMIPSFSNHFFT